MQYSVVNFKDVNINFDKRIDAEYFKPEYLNVENIIETKNWDLLVNISNVKGGKRLPIGEIFLDEGISYIRAEDIKNGFVEYIDSPKISLKLHEELKAYQTKLNDVLITIVGNSIGDIGIVKFQLEKCNLTENCAKIVTSKNIIPDYLFVFLLSKFGQNQIHREKVGTAQPKLALIRIRSFKIPILYNNFQNLIKNIVEFSFIRQELSKQLYQQAEKLFLEELNLYNWNSTHQLSYIKNFSDTEDAKRIDAEYFQPKYEEIIKAVKEYNNGWDNFGDIVSIKKCIEVGSDTYKEEGIPFVRVSNLNKFEINENNQQYISEDYYKELAENFQPKKGEILLSKDGTAGLAYHINSEPKKMIPCGGILRLKVINKEYLPEYLTLVLNSLIVQEQIERVSSGALIKHWLVDQINNTVIPKLDIEKQKEIVSKIQESFKCREQSKQLLEIAKLGVEKAIEENEETATNWINQELLRLDIKL
jgi:restriction endonuclease S subunit